MLLPARRTPVPRREAKQKAGASAATAGTVVLPLLPPLPPLPALLPPPVGDQKVNPPPLLPPTSSRISRSRSWLSLFCSSLRQAVAGARGQGGRRSGGGTDHRLQT